MEMNDTLAEMRRERRELEAKIQMELNDFATKWSLRDLEVDLNRVQRVGTFLPGYIVNVKIEV